MHKIEQNANDMEISNEMMMARAGSGLAKIVNDRFENTSSKQAIGLVGKGNNGGDTLLALIQLLQKGWKCTALLVNSRKADPLMEMFLNGGGIVFTFSDKEFEPNLDKVFSTDAIILDGVLGTGIKLPLKEELVVFLKSIKAQTSTQKVIAVDCPSGVDCDSGNVASETIPATLTVCFEAIKVGLLKEPAFGFCGTIKVVSLDLDKSSQDMFEDRSVPDQNWAASVFPKRSPFSHKGSFGKVMVTGGSINYCGAPLLSGKAAYRMGSGLVTLAVPGSVAKVIAGSVPEITWVILDEEDGVIAESAADLLLKKIIDYDCLAVGPGIGKEETTQRFLHRLLFQVEVNQRRKMGFLEGESSNLNLINLPPVVLDADALRWLANQEKWNERIKAKLVLTPHPGEMAALTGLSLAEIQEDRLACAKLHAQKWDQVVVLKGALTVVASPEGRVSVIPVANSALAKAGSGDVLTGVIASLIGQGVPLFEAAVLGAWVHGHAGVKAAEILGSKAAVLASDIISAIPQVISKFEVDC
ncbi:MAG: NAD(P)H-hydrate dehydratase [Anaerolineaceae bacterium]